MGLFLLTIHLINSHKRFLFYFFEGEKKVDFLNKSGFSWFGSKPYRHSMLLFRSCIIHLPDIFGTTQTCSLFCLKCTPLTL